MDVAQNLDREYYGLFVALIDNQAKKVRLTLQRYRQPLMTSQLEKVTNWTFKTVCDRYPGYSVVLDAG